MLSTVDSKSLHESEAQNTTTINMLKANKPHHSQKPSMQNTACFVCPIPARYRDLIKENEKSDYFQFAIVMDCLNRFCSNKFYFVAEVIFIHDMYLVFNKSN